MNSKSYGAISMKSILQSIALASAVILIASCDSSSSSGGGGTVVVPTPTDGVAGSGVKGIIDGGTLVAVDADGDQVASTLTSAGTYAIQYDAAAITAGITYPVTVTITNPNGSATTACDFQNADNSGNDCRTNDGTFVGFGTPYALPADFTLVGILSAANSTGSTTAMHVSPATNIAAALAGTPATVASVTAANLAITGLIQSITGIDLGGVDITQIATADVTGTGGSTASAAQLAVAAFAAAIVADQGAGESLNDVLTRFAASITVDASGNATGTGTAFGVIASAVARSLTTIAANTGNAQALAGATNAASNAAVYTAIGTGTVLLPPVNTDPTDVTAVSLARQFVSTLGSVIASIAGTTGSENTGGDALSVTETFATELDGVAAVSSGNATKALSKLNAALITAATGLADGATSTNAVEDGTTGDDDGIEFVLTNTAGSLTVTGVSSRWPLAEATGGNTVTITGATGTADTTGFSIPAISMVTTSGTTTLQTFTGNISVVNGASAGLFTSAAISGTVVGQTAGTSFKIGRASCRERV